jgi:hypothetical protein
MSCRWMPWDGGWILHQDGQEVLHIAKRSADDVQDTREPGRYCVFGHCSYTEYLGDLPLDMPEEELKAMAIAMWRMS